MNRIFLLGAGASADFSPASYSRGIPINGSFFIPFPTTNNFIHTAIRLDKLKEDYPIFKFISERYNIKFKELQSGKPLDIEKVYRDIYELSEQTDMKKDPESTGKAWGLLWSIEGVIEELPQHYFTVYETCNNYSIFAEHLVRTDSTVITFNWDTFLDEALFNTGKLIFPRKSGHKEELVLA